MWFLPINLIWMFGYRGFAEHHSLETAHWPDEHDDATFSGHFLNALRQLQYAPKLFSKALRSRLLQLFIPQAAEASRIHPSSPFAATAWSCLSSEKISDLQKIHRSKTKNISYKKM